MLCRSFVRLLGLVGGVALSISQPFEHAAEACSCSGPQLALVSPDPAVAAPLNTRVRLEAPSATGSAKSNTRTVLRVHHGAEVATSTRVVVSGGWGFVIELTPAQPLLPSTQYEVAAIEDGAIPPATVTGTFRTGTAADTSAPRIDALGPPVAFKNVNAIGSMCQVAGPWVVFDGVQASDPDRPDAQLAFVIWLADKAGNVDPKKTPATVVRSHDGKIVLGRSSMCDALGITLPPSGVMQLGIAALDEAGNASAMRRVRVDLAAARAH